MDTIIGLYENQQFTAGALTKKSFSVAQAHDSRVSEGFTSVHKSQYSNFSPIHVPSLVLPSANDPVKHS